MNAWTAVSGWLLVQQVASLPDTIVTKQVPIAEGWLATVQGVASTLMTLTLLVLTIVVAPAAWNFRKSYKKLNDLLDRVYADVTPIVRHTHSIADNVDYITTSIRTDVRRMNTTLAEANGRLMHAMDAAERRLKDFHALLDVVQNEAEDVFVSTASTVRGVRTGASTFRSDLEQDIAPRSSVRSGRRVRRVADEEEETDGDDDETADRGQRGTGDGGPGGERPRIRPRANDDF